MKTRRIGTRAATLLVGAALAGCGEGAIPDVDRFDVYLAGVPTARIVSDTTVADGFTDPAERRFLIELRDPRTAEWTPARAVTGGQIASGAAMSEIGFGLPLPAILAETDAWVAENPDRFIWPGTITSYVPHRELTGSVDGRPTSATYWAAQEESSPTDVVLDDSGRLIAAVNPSVDLVLVRRGYEDLTTVGRWRAAGVSRPEYGFTELEERVEMSDGVGLATLVYLPSGDVDGPYPTIFIRTPYGITDLVGQYFHYPARGFALVLQAVRGTAYWDPDRRSEGIWDPMVNEPRDGADALAWIVEQPWSDGNICMQGGSYVGYTQWSASMADNPALKCTVPESSMGTAFSDQPFMGGGFVEGLAYYMFWMLDIEILPERTWTEILHHRPIADMDVFATGRDIRQWNEMVDHWRNDAFWKRQDWYADEGERSFGTLQISGWFDDDYPGTQSNWELMQRRSSAPQHLVVGPWRHGYNRDRRLNGLSFGVDALRDDIWLLKQRWYDHFLKGIDNGVGGTVVDYFVLGDNEWRQARNWPPEESVEERWYFHSDGAAAGSAGGVLTTAPPEIEQRVDTYVYDPTDPPTNWTDFDGMTQWEDIQSFPADFAEMEARDDVAVFTSDPLAEDLTIAGPIVVELHASTDVPDTDWWAHISDVQPDGRSIRLSTGLIRARFRGLDDPVFKISGSNFETEELLSGDPSRVVRYEIGLPAVANTFKAGHRIRIAVMNALDNYSFPNSNTGEHEAHVTTTRPGTMSLHHSPGRASHVRFHVLPR
ncbi:MAG: CocE/NonD family hydrolase [Gemmatimonadota bacterium]|nr:CocE/NonD family hydrolase [Gemmatimonadota bacterium]